MDRTERLHFHFSLSCIGEGNGNPLQCSCLENPRDRGAWWAAVYRVTQSLIQLKRHNSSSSSSSTGRTPFVWHYMEVLTNFQHFTYGQQFTDRSQHSSSHQTVKISCLHKGGLLFITSVLLLFSLSWVVHGKRKTCKWPMSWKIEKGNN